MNVNLWREAVWETCDLSATEKIVALCFADHTKDGAGVWVYDERGGERCGLGASTFRRKRRSLRQKGWLRLVSEGRRGRGSLAATYDLVMPVNSALSERNEGVANAHSARSRSNSALSGPNSARCDTPSPALSPTSSPASARRCVSCQRYAVEEDTEIECRECRKGAGQ